MKRRKFVIGLGGIVSSVGAGAFQVLGTGAFNYGKASRSVSVRVADDDSAFLALDGLGSGYERADQSGEPDVVDFSIPGDDEETPEDTLGEGVGANSVYRFGPLLRITNQGDRSVAVYSEYDDTALNQLALYDTDSGTRSPILTGGDDAVTLGPGESFDAGLHLDTHGTSVRSEEYETTMRIVAREPTP